MTALFVRNPSAIVSPVPGLFHGPETGTLTEIKDASILVEDGVISEIGSTEQLEGKALSLNAVVVDASGRAVIPGFVDAHTHLVFGGNRADEFAKRTAGATYEEIAASGGGIAKTVRATRQADKAELKARAQERLDRAMRQGTTTMEVKSGYGLDTSTELKMLEVIAELNEEHPVDLIPTFLGAHAVPPSVSKQAYLDEMEALFPEIKGLACFCDIFCEQGYFSPADSLHLLEQASKHGLLPRLHANQFHSIGCIEAAIEANAVSVDHLEVLSEKEIHLLAKTDIACVMLPGVSLFLDIPFAPARQLVDAGGFPVLATDFNPGSNMSLNLQLVMSLACMRMGLSVDEALACVTRNSARALRQDHVGCIDPGWKADMLILDCSDYREMIYFYGENHVQTVIKNGAVVC